MLQITVINNNANYQARGGPIVCDNDGYRIAFAFDSEWGAYPEKTARFIWNGAHWDEKIVDNVCKVPIITDTDEVEVGVYAGPLHTTTSARISCLRSVRSGTTEQTPEQRAYEAGKKSEYDAFWDSFQKNGERRYYYYAFLNSGFGWSKKTFKPKYDIICEGSASQCFYAWENTEETINFGAVLKQQGVILDTSRATNVSNFFAYGKSFIGEFPTISCENAGANTNGLFRGCKVSKIEKLIVTEQTSFDASFSGCYELVDIVFEGTIAKGNLNTSSCTKLSKASIISVISHLSDTTTGLTVTLSKTAVDDAFEEEGGAVGSVSSEWDALVATKPNWTIALA